MEKIRYSIKVGLSENSSITINLNGYKLNKLNNTTIVVDGNEITFDTNIISISSSFINKDVAISKEDYSKISIDDLYSLSRRSSVVLNRHGINTVHDLLQCTTDDFMKMRNMGRKSLTEIEEIQNNIKLNGVVGLI